MTPRRRARAGVRIALAALAAAIPGCLGQGDFRCTRHDQCDPGGLCEPSGHCSVPAASCDSGRRYVALAGASSGACVGEACPDNPILMLSVGAAHACVLRQDGHVYCWGANDDGQLGDGSTAPRSSPVAVQGLADVKAVAAGERHTCAVLKDGAAYCWGANESRQLGDADTTSRPLPVRVAGVGHAVDIAAGSVASCAIVDDGAALCWGSNQFGQLGDGSAATQPGPIEVFALIGLRKIFAHWQHFCALRSDETLWCWGHNDSGQIGDGTTLDQPQPVRVSLNGVTGASVGLQHTCATTRADGLWCWGNGAAGQLGAGDGAGPSALRPARVPAIPDPIAVGVGAQHSCAVRVDGGAWCWGNNLSGQLGDGTGDGIDVPVPASDLKHVVQIDGGEKFTCVRRDEGTIWCWGDNHAGQLGIGTTVMRAQPAMVTLSASARAVAAGGGHTCAITGEGAVSREDVQCWGSDLAGQLGDNRTTDRARPAALKVPLDAAQIAAGAAHTCARTTDGRTFCWGRGNSGQVGPGSQVDSRLPVVALSTPASDVAAGGAHTCAVAATGGVLCWGAGGRGQLGDGTGDDHATPGPVLGNSDATAVTAGESHTCALASNGAISCWGRDDLGQLGDGGGMDQPGPIPVTLTDAPAGGATAITAGAQHTCALTQDGVIFCWGRGDAGQLGRPGRPDDGAPAAALPGVVQGVPPASAIAAGGDHTCAVAVDATVWCWGDNQQGELGNGQDGPTGEPSQVAGLTQVAGVTAGAAHTCAWRQDGTVWCWGGNQSGQLGDGVTLEVSTPQLDRISCP